VAINVPQSFITHCKSPAVFSQKAALLKKLTFIAAWEDC